jgi:hypothetical protein
MRLLAALFDALLSMSNGSQFPLNGIKVIIVNLI